MNNYSCCKPAYQPLCLKRAGFMRMLRKTWKNETETSIYTTFDEILPLDGGGTFALLHQH